MDWAGGATLLDSMGIQIPDSSKREECWMLLKSLGHGNSLPWLTIGDFNEIVGMSEKEGGSISVY